MVASIARTWNPAYPNTADPGTFTARVQLLRERFGLTRGTLVDDRGMIAQTRIEADLKPASFDWITSVRRNTIRKLDQRNMIQAGLFDTPDLASVTCEDYPGEHLLVCYNPQVVSGLTPWMRPPGAAFSRRLARRWRHRPPFRPVGAGP